MSGGVLYFRIREGMFTTSSERCTSEALNNWIVQRYTCYGSSITLSYMPIALRNGERTETLERPGEGAAKSQSAIARFVSATD